MTGTIALMLTIFIALIVCRICFSLMGIEQTLEKMRSINKEIYSLTNEIWFKAAEDSRRKREEFRRKSNE